MLTHEISLHNVESKKVAQEKVQVSMQQFAQEYQHGRRVGNFETIFTLFCKILKENLLFAVIIDTYVNVHTFNIRKLIILFQNHEYIHCEIVVKIFLFPFGCFPVIVYFEGKQSTNKLFNKYYKSLAYTSVRYKLRIHLCTRYAYCSEYVFHDFISTTT